MTWVRLADDFYDHPKLLAAGPTAGWLWVCGLAYCNRYLTDGFLPSAAVTRLADIENPHRLAARLVDIGLWESVDGGYRVHDYRDYQPTAETVRTDRAKVSARVAAWRERRSNAVTAPSGNGVGNGVGNAAPGPARPGPYPAVNTPPPPEGEVPPTPRKRGARSSRKRGNGVDPDHGETTVAASVDLAPVTEHDLAGWGRARAALASEMNAANHEALAELVPVGRAPDGGLHLRAPPGLSGMGRFRNHVARALIDAGDTAGGRCVIHDA